MRDLHVLWAGALAAAASQLSPASITQFTHKDSWLLASLDSTYIGFADLPGGTIVTNQYGSLGAIFTDGDDAVLSSSFYYPTDGKGLSGSFGQFGLWKPISVDFTAPRLSVAVEFPGLVWFTLFYQGQQIGQSSIFANGIGGPFAGIVSSVPFDRVVLDNGATMDIDSLYFGAAVPSPGGLAVLAALGVARNRRRRG